MVKISLLHSNTYSLNIAHVNQLLTHLKYLQYPSEGNLKKKNTTDIWIIIFDKPRFNTQIR